MALKTPKQRKMEARNAAIIAEWKRLTANPENARGEIAKVLLRKYGLKSRTSIWAIIKKAEAAKVYYGDDDSRAE